MATRISPRDYQYLSAYLDGQLNGRDLQRLETRLAQELDLREELNDLRRMRTVLRSLPRSRAPRNFTLTPEMAGQRQRKPVRLYPVMGFASALASLLFVLMVLGDFLGFIPVNPGGNNPALVQEAAPVAFAPPEPMLEDGAQMKSAESMDEAGAALEAETSLTDEALLQTPVEDEVLTLLMEAPESSTPTEEAVELLRKSPAETEQPLGVGGATFTETPVEVAAATQTSEAPYSILGFYVTTTPTATCTPTPMPTETPVWTPVPPATATSTPTPMPTETTSAAMKVLVEEPPLLTPTSEVLALAEEFNAAEPNAEIPLEVSRETGELAPDEQASQNADPIRPVQMIQIGLLALAVITGCAFLILRFKAQ